MKNATGLVLALGEVPSLIPAGARSALTMPPLSVVMLDHLLNEVFSPAQRAALFTDGALETTYASPKYGTFAIRAASEGEKLSLTLTRGGHAANASAVSHGAARTAVPEGPPAPLLISAPAHATVHGSAPELPGSAPEPAVEVPREVVALFETALDQALARGASDVLFTPESPPWMRVDGELLECANVSAVPPRAVELYFEPRIDAERRRTLATTGSVDFALEHASRGSGRRGMARFRGNIFRHGGGTAVALRPIPEEIPTLAELGLPAGLAQLVEQRHGLVLFTGATGSGKSTTSAALIEHLNRTRAVHIVTLEDPIEYAYPRRRAVIHQRELGRHVDGFASGLRAALRENPDVLLVGEMRDPETMRLALTAAHTGHLVLATLHSGGAVMAIDRMIDGFPEGEKSHVRHELAGTLRHVVAQQLVPATDGGRVPAVEILAVNQAVASQIREGRTHMIQTHLETGAEDGMVPMARALAGLVRAGRISRAAAMAACEDRAALERLLDHKSAVAPRSRP